MECSQAHPLLNAYADGELSLTESGQVESHVASCPQCQSELARIEALSAAVKRVAPRTAPSTLRKKWQAPEEVRQVPQSVSRFPAWIFAAAACLAIGFFFGRMTPNSAGKLSAQTSVPLAQELVASHVRSMLGTHLIDVVSSDRHTVKPWFDGKIDYAATPYDLAAAGFPLKGGRLDYVDGNPVEVFVYGRKLHVINLYVLRGEAPELPADVRGYHLLRWSAKGMTYVAVSDVSPDDLEALRKAYQAQD